MRPSSAIRLSILTLSTLILLAANAALWGVNLPSVVRQATRGVGDGGCAGTKQQGVPTIESLQALVRGTDRDPGMRLPTIPCVNCPPIQVIKQSWCVMRPPGTDCSSTPFFNNFKRSRSLHFYQCSQGVAICCTAWYDDGCCNNSETEPPCSGGGATYKCTELNCPL